MDNGIKSNKRWENAKLQIRQKYKLLVDECSASKSYIVEEIWSGAGRVESTWDVMADTEVTSHPTSFQYAREIIWAKYTQTVILIEQIQNCSEWWFKGMEQLFAWNYNLTVRVMLQD